MKRILLTLLYMTVSLSICYEAKAMMMKDVEKIKSWYAYGNW